MRSKSSISLYWGSRNTKISQFSISFFIKKNVSSFYVPMNFFMRMKIVKPLKYWLQNGSYFILIESFFSDLHNIGHTTCNAIFHNDPQIVIFEIGTVILYNMNVITLFQNAYLHIFIFTYFLIAEISTPDVAGNIFMA